MCFGGRKKKGQNETKFSLYLPKKEMKLKPDWKAGNKTEGRGSRKMSAGTIRNTVRQEWLQKDDGGNKAS